MSSSSETPTPKRVVRTESYHAAVDTDSDDADADAGDTQAKDIHGLHHLTTMERTVAQAADFLGPDHSVLKTRSGHGTHPSILALVEKLKGVDRVAIFPSSASFYASRDLAAYRAHYNNKTPNDLHMSANVKFYRNTGRCRPDKLLISEVHQQWLGDYQQLEQAHGYIQWLFPIHEPGMNCESQILQQHEADAMRDDPAVQARLLTSYRLMLDFYGFQLVDSDTGTICRHPDAKQWRGRFSNLCHMGHNFLRITRILKCLGELNREHFKAPFLCEFLRQIIIEKALPSASLQRSLSDFWLWTVKNDTDRDALWQIVKQFATADKGGQKH